MFYEVCAGNGQPVYLPVPWASAAVHSYLVSADGFRATMIAAGLTEELRDDVTGAAIGWVNGLTGSPGRQPAVGHHRSGLGLLMGPTAGEKGRNMALNLREHRITVGRGVYRA